jgi:hypothetical protein
MPTEPDAGNASGSDPGGIRDLELLLRSMEPELLDGEFVFVSVPGRTSIAGLGDAALASVREPEGVTLVLPRSTADAAGLTYDFVAAWITLRVHSALDAVGLTAAVAGALAGAGISCNVVAGRFHDHLLVPHERADDAQRVLLALAAG